MKFLVDARPRRAAAFPGNAAESAPILKQRKPAMNNPELLGNACLIDGEWRAAERESVK
ncbi:MAG: hypothetical protein Q8O52_22410 [Sulfuritalea sp.]|nr:hypothetical protein [Sulfuritalea sp.]